MTEAHMTRRDIVLELVRMRAENERLRAIVVRAKDALLDGQSTQLVHDLLVSALGVKP